MHSKYLSIALVFVDLAVARGLPVTSMASLPARREIEPSVAKHISPAHISQDGGRCGEEHDAICATGLCCSWNGYCGRGRDYCSVPGNCQEAYGWCDTFAVPLGYDVAKDKRRYDARLPAYIDKCSVPGTLALTFDDGPSNYTEQLLNVLKGYGARATFFVNGNVNGRGQVDTVWAKTLVRMIMEGHQIGSHTWSHPDMDNISSATRKLEMYKDERAIANAIGRYPTFVRAPMTRCGEDCSRDIKSLGYHIATYQFDSWDWREERPSIDEVIDEYSKAMQDADQNGSMFLIQHDTHPDAVELTRKLLQHTRSDWHAVTLVECLGLRHEDSLRFSTYQEFSNIAPHGCLFAAPGFCYNPTGFSDSRQCNEEVQRLRNAHKACLATHIARWGEGMCGRVDIAQKQLNEFCKTCSDSGDAKTDTRCESRNFAVKDRS